MMSPLIDNKYYRSEIYNFSTISNINNRHARTGTGNRETGVTQKNNNDVDDDEETTNKSEYILLRDESINCGEKLPLRFYDHSFIHSSGKHPLFHSPSDNSHWPTLNRALLNTQVGLH